MIKRLIGIIVLVFLSIVLYPTALNLNFDKVDDIEVLLSKSLSSKEISLFSLSLNRCVFNEVNKEKVNYNLLGIKFLSSQELLKSKNDKFHAVSISFNPKKDKATVTISYYKASILYLLHYEKRNGSWKETESDWGRAKFGESKPYYIYWEIVRRINPNYMDFKAFGIPKDSLK